MQRFFSSPSVSPRHALHQAAILSVLLPGAGQLYQRRLTRGLLLFTVFATSFWRTQIPLLPVLVALGAGLECYLVPRASDLAESGGPASASEPSIGGQQRYLVFFGFAMVAFFIWFFALCGDWIWGQKAHAASSPDLVDVQKVDFTLRVEMVFAGTENLAQKKILPENRCILRRPVADALARAQSSLKLQGLGLKVLDCYRPTSLEMKFVEWMPKAVAEKLKTHNNPFYRGAAVDVWLVQEDGQPVSLPGHYEWAPKERQKKERVFTGAVLRKAKRNVQSLQQAMAREGFVVDSKLWWRYRFNTWEQFPVSDMPFSEIP